MHTRNFAQARSAPQDPINTILESIQTWHRNDQGDDYAVMWSGKTRWGFLPAEHRDARQLVFDEVLKDSITDVYVTPSSLFKGWACEALVKRLNGCWVDLDCHRHGLSGIDAWRHMEATDWFHEHGVPEPSQVTFSGRGLYLVWLLDGSPDAFKRTRWMWEKVQARLCDLLADLGADRAAMNAGRFLRPAGSINSKADRPVEVLSETGDEYQLEELAEALGVEVPPQGARKPGRQGAKVEALRVRWTPGRFNRWSLNHSRLTDLALVNDLRHGFREGHRDLALLYYTTTLRLLGRTDDQVQVEAHAFNEGFTPPLRKAEVDKVVRYCMKQDYGDRRKVARNRRILADLEITTAEQARLSTIIAGVEKERRLAAQLQATPRGRRILALFTENPGITQVALASLTGSSQATVSRTLKGAGRVPYSTKGRPRNDANRPRVNPRQARPGNYSL